VTTLNGAGVEVSMLDALNPLTAPANATGLPALAQPCGLSSSGLPISLQIMGRPFDEVSVLRAGLAYEARTSWHLASPPLFP